MTWRRPKKAFSQNCFEWFWEIIVWWLVTVALKRRQKCPQVLLRHTDVSPWAGHGVSGQTQCCLQHGGESETEKESVSGFSSLFISDSAFPDGISSRLGRMAVQRNCSPEKHLEKGNFTFSLSKKLSRLSLSLQQCSRHCSCRTDSLSALLVCT